MPWNDPNKPKRRPWRRAAGQDVYDELHSIRAYLVQHSSAHAAHTLSVSRIESRLASIEAQLAALAVAVPIETPPAAGRPVGYEVTTTTATVPAATRYEVLV